MLKMVAGSVGMVRWTSNRSLIAPSCTTSTPPADRRCRGPVPTLGDVDETEVDPEVPTEVLAELRSVCLGLPEAYEEPAWVGTRWCIRKRTFAHVFAVDTGSPPSLAKIARAIGPGTVLVFRSAGPELVALRSAGPPFFHAGWGRDVIAMTLDRDTDWTEVAELLTESYCAMAPKKLQAQVDRPPA